MLCQHKIIHVPGGTRVTPDQVRVWDPLLDGFEEDKQQPMQTKPFMVAIDEKLGSILPYLREKADLDIPDVYGRTARQLLDNLDHNETISTTPGEWGEWPVENKPISHQVITTSDCSGSSFWYNSPNLKQDMSRFAHQVEIENRKMTLEQAQKEALNMIEGKSNLSVAEKEVIRRMLVKQTTNMTLYIQRLQQYINSLKERNAKPLCHPKV